jgi:phospholipid/cholesterol/gamma-HCH transport system ATP-binding protein
VIQVENLTRSFDENLVLDNLCLNVEEGETVVVIGRSGCGKSVLLKHIIGLLKPDSGRIIVKGQDITSLGERELNRVRRLFGVVFQGSALFDSLTVAENVAFGLTEHTRMSRAEIEAKVARCLEMVGMNGVQNKMPSELSGGMKKRVALARAIAFDPSIILYDEPTTGLDPIMADVINDLIVSLSGKLAVTSVAVTHDMSSAYKIAHRIAMLYDGKIIETGTPEQIRNSRNPIVQQFIQGKAEGPITRPSQPGHWRESP